MTIKDVNLQITDGTGQWLREDSSGKAGTKEPAETLT